MSPLPKLTMRDVKLSLSIETIHKIKQFAAMTGQSFNHTTNIMLVMATRDIALNPESEAAIEKEIHQNFNRREKIRDAEAAARGEPRRKIKPEDVTVIPAKKPARYEY